MEARIAIEFSAPGSHSKMAPAAVAERRRQLSSVVEQAGGSVVDPAEANALIWLTPDSADGLSALLDANEDIQWVQLPWAGVEAFNDAGLFNRDVTFTCAKGAYGGQVGEHALMLTLTSLRHVTKQARTAEWHQTSPESLHEKRVTILGAGGIATTLIKFLKAAECDVTVIRRSAEPVTGANRTVPMSQLHDVLPDTDILVLALSLTPETRNIIGEKELTLLPDHAVVVNVARGGHVDTEALVKVLQTGGIAAAGLDVTEPEPLPGDHPLWAMDNVLITSHCADSPAYVTEKLGERITANIQRFKNGQDLIGLVDGVAGY